MRLQSISQYAGMCELSLVTLLLNQMNLLRCYCRIGLPANGTKQQKMEKHKCNLFWPNDVRLMCFPFLSV